MFYWSSSVQYPCLRNILQDTVVVHSAPTVSITLSFRIFNMCLPCPLVLVKLQCTPLDGSLWIPPLVSLSYLLQVVRWRVQSGYTTRYFLCFWYVRRDPILMPVCFKRKFIYDDDFTRHIIVLVENTCTWFKTFQMVLYIFEDCKYHLEP